MSSTRAGDAGPGPSAPRLRTIDAARGLAALWVLVFHSLIYLDLPLRGGLLGHTGATFAVGAPDQNAFRGPPESRSVEENTFRQLTWPLRIGHLGVPMFFVISGFCIHFPAARLLGRGSSIRVHPWTYTKRRFWRLYPTHFVAIAGSIALVHLGHFVLVSGGLGPIESIPFRVVVAHFAMLQAQLPSTAGYVFYYNGNLWSLETEVQLYAAYLLLLPLSRRIGWTWLLPMFAVIDVFYSAARIRWSGSFEINWVMYTFFVQHLYNWCLGAFLAEEFCTRRPGSAKRIIATLVVSVVLIVVSAYAIPFNTTRLSPVIAMLFSSGFTFILWIGLLREERHGDGRRTIAVRVRDWFAAVGERSYSLYLWHSPVLRLVLIMAIVIVVPWLGNSYAVGLLVSVVGGLTAYFVSWLAFHTVEKYCLKNRTGKFVTPVEQTPKVESSETAEAGRLTERRQVIA